MSCRAWAPPTPSLTRVPTYVAVFALVLAYLALVTAYLALRTLARLRRATSVLARGGDGHETIIEATERHIELSQALAAEVTELRRQVEARPPAQPAAPQDAAAVRAELAEVKKQLAETRAVSDRGLRNVALVRFDAFDDMAGRLSFALALLDDAGDGVAVTALTGRSDTRVYGKGITAGRGEHELSPEEQQAVDAAMGRSHDGLARLLRRRAS